MNRTMLVAAFAATLFSTAAIAQSSEDQQACMNDAFRVCSHTIPDRNRTAACMFQNMSQLSPACQVVMNKYAPGGTLSASVASRPAAPMMSRAVLTKPAAMKTASTRPGKPLNILMR